ncbi:MAG: hypothetical protein HOI39_01400 [Flavobacteriales bacterium]|nr:hypothetical protein [Flavobacteriales bacterium]
MATTQENRIIFSIEFTEKGAIRKIDGVTTSVKKFDAELKKATLANKQFNNTLSGREGMTTNAGLAGATLTELGRTISDMPYGIRGVANNLSQLSTLFTTMVAKVDDNVKGFARVGRAFKMLKTQMMGPLGIVLVFQAAISALDYFAGSTRGATKEVDALRDALSKQKGLNQAISIYIGVLENASSTEEQRIIALAKLQKEGYDPAIGSLEEFIAALKQKQKMDLLDVKNAEKVIDAETLIAESKEKIANAQEKINTSFDISQSYLSGTLAEDQRRIQLALIDLEQKKIEAVKNDLKSFIKEIGADPDIVENPFLASIFGLKESKGDADKESPVSKIIKKLNQEVQKMAAENADELLETERQLALDEIALAEGSTTEKNEAIRLIDEKFRLSVKQLREEDLEEFKDYVSKSVEESIDIIDDLYKEFLSKNKEAAKDARKFISDYIKGLQNDLRQLREQESIFNQAFSSTAKVLNSLNDLRQEHHQAQLDRLARERDVVLANDTLTQAEKEKRLQGISHQEMIAQKKKIKLERDMFTIEQTLMIAKTLMNAQFFAQQQIMMAQIAVQNGVASARQIALTATVEGGKAAMSLGSFMTALGPAGIIAFGASIGVALASIKKARDAAKNQIANLVPGASSVGGGSSPSVQAPAFNVVGATQESQLAQAISGADSKPLKAFVVASDISTAQELERSTIEGASIG